MKDKFWIAFTSIEEIDSDYIIKLFTHFGDIEVAFNACENDLKQIAGLSVAKTQKFLKKRDLTDIEKVYDAVLSRGIKYININDDKYPSMLKNISNPPAVLYYKGDLSSCNLNRTVAFVGSRKASSHGREDVRKIISELSGTDICIVSGLASGIDTTAHNAAVDSNLKTIGVIASGFDYTYPASNKALYEKIEQGSGAIVTEYFPTFEPLKYRFPQRNRIVSGLAYGTVVAEASLKSGALITANLTLEQGRELMCIPGLISNPNTQGIYKLLKNGATIVTESSDILNALNWELPRLGVHSEQLNLPTLTEDEEKIYETIKIEEKSVDEIKNQTGLDIDSLLINLTTMELKGIIKQCGGDRYKKV